MSLEHLLLQEIASCVATPRSSASSAHIDKTRFNIEFVTLLESWIDQMDEVLPPLRNFILPSGGKSGAALHVARSICRRAERRVCELVYVLWNMLVMLILLLLLLGSK